MSRMPDFSGWATRINIKCGDGRTIMDGAFKDQDRKKIPMVWQHQHGDVSQVLGHAVLENRPGEGVYAYGFFNNTPNGQNAKQCVVDGDVTGLSIFANNLEEDHSRNVFHGIIRELSLCLAQSNPGAYIDEVLAHSDGSIDSAVIFTGDPIFVYDETNGDTMAHSEDDKDQSSEASENEDATDVQIEDTATNDELSHSDDSDDSSDDGLTAEEIKEEVEGMTKKQKAALETLVGAAITETEEALSKKESDEQKEDTEMKHNAFEGEAVQTGNVISLDDQATILDTARKPGINSFQHALEIYQEEHSLAHDNLGDQVGGFVQSGSGNVTELFPDYKDARPGMPELITDDQTWVNLVMNKVNKLPFARVRTRHVDIRNIDALRAKGYRKGDKKALTGNFNLVTRTMDPQTVYVKNALNRDDIADITDFNYVEYLYKIDRMMLMEELATAIVFGDGREDGDPDKIYEAHIKSIWNDDELYTIHKDLDIEAAKADIQGTNTGANFGDNYVYAEAMVNAVLYALEEYKGSGAMDMLIDQHVLNIMLLARDRNGRRIYQGGVNELATVLGVKNIQTVEGMRSKTRVTSQSKTKRPLAILVNFADYSTGNTKDGALTHFNQFDIDYNQEKSLLETRLSGGLTRIKSAIAIEEEVTNP